MRRLNIHPNSAPGRFYVDAGSCTCTTACLVEAPENIKIDEEQYTAFVFKQPTSIEEEAALQIAIQVCPYEAVLDEGNEPS
jgi:ferredoxin